MKEESEDSSLIEPDLKKMKTELQTPSPRTRPTITSVIGISPYGNQAKYIKIKLEFKRYF